MPFRRSARLLGVLLALGSAVPAWAAAAAGPSAVIGWGGFSAPLALRLADPVGGVIGFSSDELFLMGDGSVRTSCSTDVVCDGSVRIQGSFKSDPFIAWTMAIVDFGGATNFTISFVAPTVDGPYTQGTNTVEGLFSALAANVEATAATGADIGSLADHAALTLADPDCPTSSACGAIGSRSAAGSYESGYMRSRLAFGGAGADSAYGFGLRFEIGHGRVPEPGTALLIVGAMLAALGARRRGR